MTSAVEYQIVLSIGSELIEGSYSFRGTVKVLKNNGQWYTCFIKNVGIRCHLSYDDLEYKIREANLGT
jgi:hypothetical protein